ncbi:META domain-containing protein [Corynebacterium sp. zg-331]|uniref:META domain-containing protein n=1 Tax=unclassified Corynebacterium TaxID=2624378 RepID=UPI00128DB938|nr:MULTISPECIES: META domain-containing protein [unclassified Corynebacterium]MBC3185832.1 META domain-containing protein [Corynebacterium sp. zg-331]MPV52323.1 META domain-containing protein [Corynebacterium sp. zg331]
MSLRSSLAVASAVLLAGATTAHAASLTDTEWALADAPDAFFVLHENGTLSGNDGCNVFGGSAALDGDVLTVGGLSSTLRYCDMEVSLTSILNGTTAVTVTGDTLTLTDAQGAEWAFTTKK